MPIFKIHNKTNYAAIPNDTLRDKRLSIESRGVLAYLLTHNSTFEITLEFLQKELSIGRDKMKNIIRELKLNGYLCLVAAHNKKGNFSGQEWYIYAESQGVDFTTHTIDRLTEKPSDGKTDRRLNRQTENPSDILKENSSQKKIEEEKKRDIYTAHDLTEMVDAEFAGELDQTLEWIRQQKGVSKIPQAEWIHLLEDLEAESISLNGFKEFYLWVENLDWVTTVSPKLMQGQLEAYKNREKIQAKKQSGAKNGNNQNNNGKYPAKRTDEDVFRESAEFYNNPANFS